MYNPTNNFFMISENNHIIEKAIHDWKTKNPTLVNNDKPYSLMFNDANFDKTVINAFYNPQKNHLYLEMPISVNQGFYSYKKGQFLLFTNLDKEQSFYVETSSASYGLFIKKENLLIHKEGPYPEVLANQFFRDQIKINKLNIVSFVENASPFDCEFHLQRANSNENHKLYNIEFDFKESINKTPEIRNTIIEIVKNLDDVLPDMTSFEKLENKVLEAEDLLCLNDIKLNLFSATERLKEKIERTENILNFVKNDMDYETFISFNNNKEIRQFIENSLKKDKPKNNNYHIMKKIFASFMELDRKVEPKTKMKI